MGLTVAIIGRPNVGKSTLFNRFVGRRAAIVDDTPGVTRDRKTMPGKINGLPVTLVDTAGYEEIFDGRLEARMREQTEVAIEEADICIFLIDARAGVTTLDETFAALLRKAEKPVIVCANKCEGRAAEPGLIEGYSLGLGEPVALSAEHGLGLADLAERIIELAGELGINIYEDEPAPGEDRPEGPMRIAIVGRPNVGKSTLINTLLGEDRLLTGPEAGITRDSIAVDAVWQGRKLAIFDTAGMRRRARVKEKLEGLSVGDTINAIKFADVVVVLMEADNAFEKQDLQIADLVIREGRALVLGLNKWDLVDDRARAIAHFEKQAETFLPQVRGVPLVPVSGETRFGLERLLKAVFAAHETWNKRVSTGQLNRWLEGAVTRHPPPAVKGRRIKLRYVTQVKARPPSFVIFCQRAEELPDDYHRYLVSGLRKTFGLEGVPIRLTLRARENPYADKTGRR